MSEKNKSKKIGPKKYSVPIPKRRFSINISDKLCVVNHKNRWVVALTTGEGWQSSFRSNQTINRTQAIRMIGFLSEYINMVKPTNTTELHSNIKVSTNRIARSASELVAVALKNEGAL